MSDHPSIQDALPVRLGLQRCGGGPGCPCVSSSSSVGRGLSASASPSGSRTHTSGDTASGDSGSHRVSASQEVTDSAVPQGDPVQEWSGLGTVRVGRCEHDRYAVLKKCCAGKHTGRRFLGCPLEDESDQCQFMEWLDEPWPEHVQSCLKELWIELKKTRRYEATANASLIEALQIKEVATQANDNLVAKVNRTKRLAHKVCRHYHMMTAVTIKEKNKLMHFIYFLLGVIAFLVAVIFYMAK